MLHVYTCLYVTNNYTCYYFMSLFIHVIIKYLYMFICYKFNAFFRDQERRSNPFLKRRFDANEENIDYISYAALKLHLKVYCAV